MSVTTEKMTGKVKWFNNKAGYGFITVSQNGDFLNKDIFVHYSNINVSNSQYKYLVQGEYIEFDLEKTENGQHEFQAKNITGINGGSIMCESRRSIPVVVPAVENDRPPRNTPSSYVPRKPRLLRENTRVPESVVDDGFTTVAKRRFSKNA